MIMMIYYDCIENKNRCMVLEKSIVKNGCFENSLDSALFLVKLMIWNFEILALFLRMFLDIYSK